MAAFFRLLSATLVVLLANSEVAQCIDELIQTWFNASSNEFSKTIGLPPNSRLDCFISSVPSNVSFLIFQAHSHLYDITLSYPPIPSKRVNGSNVGLVVTTDQTPSDSYHLQVNNFNPFKTYVLVGFVPYGKSSPVPGGCNTEFPVDVAPYLQLKFDSSMITVDGSLAGLVQPKAVCPQETLSYEMFYTFMPERDFSKETYFSFISLGMSGPTIQRWSVAPPSLTLPSLRRVFSAYKGTGVVFNIRVRTRNGTSAYYVPIHTYSCENPSASNACSEFNGSSFLKVVLVLLLIGGVVLVVGGHITFGYELIILGTLFGSLVSYVVLKRLEFSSFDPSIMSLGVGIACGVLWASIWWLVRIPILSVSLPLFCLSLFCACIIMPFCVGTFSAFENDTNFWVAFFAIAFFAFCVFLCNTVKHSMRTCSFVGSYILLIPVDYYCGTGWKYLVINVLRRATVEGFNVAITPFTFQVPDIILLVAWVVVAYCSMKGQLKMSRGRAPYPAPCRLLTPPASESTPLLPTSSTSSDGWFRSLMCC